MVRMVKGRIELWYLKGKGMVRMVEVRIELWLPGRKGDG